MKCNLFSLRRILTVSTLTLGLMVVGCGPPQPIAEDSNSAVESAAGAEPTEAEAVPKADANEEPAAPTEPDAETPGESATPAAETEASGVSLREVSPKEFPQLLEKYRGQVVLVDFWAMWCIPCREKFPETVELSCKYSDDGLAVVSINLDDPEGRDAARKFLESQNAPFDHLASSQGSSDKSFEGFEIEGGALPHFKLYDRKGVLRHTFSSSDPLAERQFTHADIEQRVQELLAEKE